MQLIFLYSIYSSLLLAVSSLAYYCYLQLASFKTELLGKNFFELLLKLFSEQQKFRMKGHM